MGSALAAALAVDRARRGVRTLRHRATTVAPLDHDLTLGGAAPPRRLVVLGDSAAAGHGLPDAEAALARRIGRALHARDGRATDIVSVARDGATTAAVRAEQLGALAGATDVVIGVGVNDALHGRPARRSAHHLAAVLEAALVEVAGPDRVVVLTCPDLSAAPGVPALLRPLVGWRCRAAARAQAAVVARTGVGVVPAPRSVLWPSAFGPDGFHPGAEGHTALADAVVAHLAGQVTGRPRGE
jgi:lysophospholipase L1-like esterase